MAERLREAYAGIPDVVEKKMFGGLTVMVAGHMSCGVVNDTLMVRVGPDQYAQALGKPHVREMDFTGKPLKGFVYVAPDGLAAKEQLNSRVTLSLNFVTSLPPK
ncbi:MAG: TfoX/Sxy family protein [Gammaproteobacteria bacterium]|nr:TfoX/Sxy family protein [Gammaproteobacteria bacterium]